MALAFACRNFSSVTRLLCSKPLLNQKCCSFYTLRKVKLSPKALYPFKPQQRSYFGIFKKRTKRQLRDIDNPPASYKLIYRFGFDHYVLGFQHLGFYAIVIVSLLYLTKTIATNDTTIDPREFSDEEDEETDEKEELTREWTDVEHTFTENEALLFVAAFYVVFFLIRVFIERMPMRIYVNPETEKYLLYFYSTIPNSMKKTALRAGDIVGKPAFTFVPWSEGVFAHRKTGETYIMLEEYFRTPADLYILLGLQKDPDYDYEKKNETKH